MKRTAIIIGGGISGLATANLLARDGYRVTLLEQSAQLGGRAGFMQMQGFSFDTGPSWYLMPDIFEHYFSLFGRHIKDYLTLTRLQPAYRIFPQNAPTLTISGHLDQDAATFEQLESGAGEALRRHVARATKLYEVARRRFLYIDRLVASSFIQPDVLGALGAAPKTPYLNTYIERHFKHPVLRQALQYYSVFLGVSPYRAPSLYALMSHLDFQQGVFYPQGGIYEVIRALEKLGQELGVTHRLNTPVAHINSRGARATGVTLADGTALAADLVVSAADLHHTEQSLLDPAARSLPPTFWQKAQPSPSAILMYLGVKDRLPQLAHHNLFFTTDWQQNFGDIFQRRVLPHPASMYVCAPSVTDATVAPAGHENLFVLVPVPATPTPLTSEQQATAAQAYLEQLAHAIGVPDLQDRLVVNQTFGPADFAKQFNAWQGSGLGLGHTWGQSAWFRPGVKSKRLHNFYTVGGNVRPGIGLPMCLISAQLVIKDLHHDRTDGPLAPRSAP
jgi:phytoene desaturase